MTTSSIHRKVPVPAVHLGHTRHRRAVTGGRRQGLAEALTLHLVEHPRHRSAQHTEVIAPFEHRGDAAAHTMGEVFLGDTD